MLKILIATHNQAKYIEIKSGLRNLEEKNIKLISLDEINITTEPVESGKTFQENSLLKAKYYAQLSQLPVIADDGGLCIDYLNGEPGVKSRRWPGYEASDQELIDYTLLHLRGVNQAGRTSQMKTCITFFNSGNQITIQETEQIDGFIAEKSNEMETNGFPFRALFIVSEFDKYYGELTHKENNKINHRLKALKRLSKKILSNLVE